MGSSPTAPTGELAAKHDEMREKQATLAQMAENAGGIGGPAMTPAARPVTGARNVLQTVLLDSWTTTSSREHLASDHESEGYRFANCRAHVKPPIEVCTKPRQSIHCTCTKIGIGRGLELLSETGCLRGGASQWRNRLREMKDSAAGCSLERKTANYSDEKRSARALPYSCSAFVRRLDSFPTDERALCEPAGQVGFSQLSPGVEERFGA